MSVIKRLVNVATWRVRRILAPDDGPHPGEAALDDELREPPRPVERDEVPADTPEVTAPPPGPKTRRL